MSATSDFSSLFSSDGTVGTGSSSHGSVSRGASGFSGPGSYARSSPFSRFQSSKLVSGTRAFLESNSIVAKFAFLLLVLLVFIVLLRVGTYLVGLIFEPSSAPMLVSGMVDSRQMIVIPQNPNVKGSKSILRSVNQTDGMEFTWVCWMWIDDLQYKAGQYKHVFHKGDDTMRHTGDMAGTSFPNNAPGLYIAPNTNELVVIMNTFNDITEEVTISDIPIQKWICVMVRVSGRNLDVFINGVLTQRHVLASVPKQNYGDVYVSMNGGFSGYTSSLQYFDYALGMAKIQSLVSRGPSLKMDAADLTKTMPRYLSSRWFFVGTEDAYNP
jgi:hypothetical protein